MSAALLRRSIREARLLLVASTLIMFAFCWLRVWIISLLPTERFRTIVEQFREFERFVPVPFEQLFTYSGRLALTYDELIVVMCVVIWAIARGSDCVAGELGRGTLEMILAQPVSRLRLLATEWLVTTGGLVVLALASWLGLYTGIHTTTVDEPLVPVELSLPLLGFDPAQDWLQREALAQQTRPVAMASRVDARDLLPAALNLFALGFFLAGLSALISSLDRYRWRVIGVVSAIYVVQLVLKIIGLASTSWSWLLKYTFFTAYDPERFVSIAVNSPADTWRLVLTDASGQWVELGPAGYSVLLIVLGMVAYLVAAIVFQRRDLPAPV